MAYFTNKGLSIAGISCVVPKNKVTVKSFNSVFGEEAADKFTEGTGIAQMYKALPQQTAGDLAYSAAEKLLAEISIERSEIGALVFVTQSPDYRRPATACVLQKRLGLAIDCAVMDVGLGCSGFVYGLQTAMSLMTSSDMKYALLLLGETASKLVNPLDKSIVMMYGDAGAAVLLERSGEEMVTTLLKSDGNRFSSIVLPAGGFRDMNPTHETFLCSDGIERSLYDIFMDGTSVFSFSITDVPQTIKEYLAYTGSSVDDFDTLVFHQANQFILKQITRKIKAQKEKVPISLDRFGNTGGISIPLTLCDTFGTQESKKIKALMCGFGIGLSWGVTSAVLDTENIFPIAETEDYFAEGKFQPGKY
ncbi:MAG: ketoacyl-ACP synthase III [Eubacteriales bacterium]|nr:ketoacyl-ACP synthase III [Eubacteriales bacterium]